MHSRGSRPESRRSFLQRVAAAGASVWTVPAIAFAARRPKPPSPGHGECVGEDPSHGHCTTSSQCGLGVCDFTTCVPSTCWCELGTGGGGGPGIWVCTSDCGGRCI